MGADKTLVERWLDQSKPQTFGAKARDAAALCTQVMTEVHDLALQVEKLQLEATTRGEAASLEQLTQQLNAAYREARNAYSAAKIVVACGLQFAEVEAQLKHDLTLR